MKKPRVFCRFVSLSVCWLVLFISCSRPDPRNPVLARVEGREFTRSDLASAAGVPLDSISSATRWRILETWVERILVDLEGERLNLNEDRELREKFSALKSDLYRARLLSDKPPPLPSDSALMNYYMLHQQEFLRPMDAYLIELYWAEDISRLMEFRQQLARGDSTLLAQNVVASEGRWLAETGELDSALERELDGLEASAITMPRPYGDGYRAAQLLEKYPAGTVMHIDAVRDEIVQRLLIEENRRRQDQLVIDLRQRYTVEVMIKDSL